MHFIKAEEDFLNAIPASSLVCIENNILKFSHKTVSIFDKPFDGLQNPVFLFGEEQKGISENVLERCERIITIPSFGSVRSLNVSSCASTVFAFYRNYYDSLKKVVTKEKK
jgi:tRNA(Leu) C34 or U34 (ribose-2'-O)-methylase TrmL